MIRKATEKDIKAIAAVYEDIHTEEEAGRLTIGWQRGVYPTEQTAADSVAKGDMFVCERNGHVVAAAKINKEQVDVYADGKWEFEAKEKGFYTKSLLLLYGLCSLFSKNAAVASVRSLLV